MLLKKIRLKKGWTQSYVASKLNVSVRFYRSTELGEKRPSYKNINKLEDLFELPQRILLAKDIKDIPNYYKQYKNEKIRKCI